MAGSFGETFRGRWRIGWPVHRQFGARDSKVEYARRRYCDSVSDGGSIPPAYTISKLLKTREKADFQGFFAFFGLITYSAHFPAFPPVSVRDK